MRFRRFAPIIILMLLVIGCSGLQDKWNKLTPDEKARIIIGDIQGQLENAFNTGKAYVDSKPEYATKWKAEIIPAFDVANKSLASVIEIGKTKPLTPSFVYAKVQGNVNNVMTYLIQIGAIKK